MKSFLTTVLALLAAVTAAANTPDTAALKQLALEKLAPLARDPAIVAAVKAQNAEGKTLADIQAADKVWMATPGLSDAMKAIAGNAAAEVLRGARKTFPALSEAFVMDKLGANVAMTDKTSDYWQGDETKFTDAFRAADAVWIGKVDFDESTQTYSVQISVPVLDGGTPIGAVCFGIDIEKL